MTLSTRTTRIFTKYAEELFMWGREDFV